MSDITIPPEALEAAQRAFNEAWINEEDTMRAACLAMLRAWQTEKHKMIVGVALDEVGGQYPAIILPLKETDDDWVCPIGVKSCTENCGSYGCGN